MKVNKIITYAFLMFLSLGSANAYDEFTFKVKHADEQPIDKGCYIKDRFFAVGTRNQMNRAELALFKKKTGFRASDGYAVMMMCIYIVDPLSDDHPHPNVRRYVWVAS
jgi:hypothetical protein|tara:strand:- start:12210 stop:12533 length:324 start_codon:yes stop_codon:yes gene_type:complete